MNRYDLCQIAYIIGSIVGLGILLLVVVGLLKMNDRQKARRNEKRNRKGDA